MKDTPRRLVLPDLDHCSSSNRACSSWPIHDVLGVPYVQTGTRHEPAPVGDFVWQNTEPGTERDSRSFVHFLKIIRDYYN